MEPANKPSKDKNLRVGIFLAIGIFVLMVSIVLLGGDKAFLKHHIVLFAKLNQVQGLDRGSVVSLAGVTIGNVNQINFSSDKKSLEVEMKIQEDFLPLLTQGSTADVRTQGALGDKYIYITPGDSGAAILKAGDHIETAKSTDIMGMLSEKGNEASRIFDIIDEVYKLTKIINAEGRSDKIIANLVDSTASIKSLSEDTRKLISEIKTQDSQALKQSIEHLNSVLAKIDKGEGTLGALVNDSALHDRLKTLLGTDSHRQAIQSLIRTSIQKSDNK